ncbi:MAG: amidase, partial [Chloroflexota bacterium]
MSNIAFLPATELSQAIRRKQLSPVEVIEAVFAQIHAHNPQLNAFCTLTEDQARAEARAAEAAVMRGDPLGPLHGIPISIKDLFFTKDVRTMRGSRLYQDFVPTFDAPVVERTKRAGAIVIGNTTTPEFGYKGLTDSAVT